MSTNNFDKFLNIDDEHKRKQSKKNLTVKKESGININLKLEGKEKIINNAVLKDIKSNEKDKKIEERGRKVEKQNKEGKELKEEKDEKEDNKKNIKDLNIRGKSVDAFEPYFDYLIYKNLNNLYFFFPLSS